MKQIIVGATETKSGCECKFCKTYILYKCNECGELCGTDSMKEHIQKFHT